MIYLIGESHNDYKENKDRLIEFENLKKLFGVNNYFKESEFRSSELSDDGKTFLFADPLIDHQRAKLIVCAQTIRDELNVLKANQDEKIPSKIIEGLEFNYSSVNNKLIQFFSEDLTDAGKEYQLKNLPVSSEERIRLKSSVEKANYVKDLLNDVKISNNNFNPESNFLSKKINKSILISKMEKLLTNLHNLDMSISGEKYHINELDRKEVDINTHREKSMLKQANSFSEEMSAVWKVGNKHIKNILDKNGPHKNSEIRFMIISREELSKILLKEGLKNDQSNLGESNAKTSFTQKENKVLQTRNSFKI